MSTRSWSKQTFEQFWGGRLRTWPQDVIEQLGCGQAAKEFLAGIGLPVGGDWTLSFDLPRPGEPAPRLLENSQFVVLGRDDEVPLCLDEGHGDRIVCVDAEVMLVNSSLESLGRFLVLYEDYRQKVRGLPAEAAERLVEETKLAMAAEDETALAVESNYWSLIVEQMEAGLL